MLCWKIGTGSNHDYQLVKRLIFIRDYFQNSTQKILAEGEAEIEKYQQSKVELSESRKQSTEKLLVVKSLATMEEHVALFVWYFSYIIHQGILNSTDEDLHKYSANLIAQMNEKEKRFRTLLNNLDDYEVMYEKLLRLAKFTIDRLSLADINRIQEDELEKRAEALTLPLHDVLETIDFSNLEALKTVVANKQKIPELLKFQNTSNIPSGPSLSKINHL